MIALPMLHPFGLLDPWLAWAVYDSGSPKVSLTYSPDVDYWHRPSGEVGSTVDIPDELLRGSGREHAWADVQLNGVMRLNDVIPVQHARDLLLGRWSIDTLGVPHSPQERFQVGVAIALVGEFPQRRDGGWWALNIRRPADPWSGRWEEVRWYGSEPWGTSPLLNSDTLRRHAETYRFNALPRVR